MYTPTRVKDNYSSHYDYDKAGNLQHLTRYGFTGLDASQDPTYGLIDQLTYTYDLDFYLTGVTNDLNVASDEYGFKGGGSGYQYDLKGNMTNSTLNGMTIQYNHINLPGVVDSDEGSQKAHYSLGGSKMLTVNEYTDPLGGPSTDLTRMYFMGLELEYEGVGSFSSTFTPKSYHFGDGRLLFDGSDIRKQYHLHDHLGNVVVVFEDKDNDGILEETSTLSTNEVPNRYHYYSFGMQWDLGHTTVYIPPDYSEDNRYEYNGKEYEPVAQVLDYGWRWYDPVIGRWGGVDPLAEKYYPYSSYAYVANNPIIFIDPDGRSIGVRKNENGTYTVVSGTLEDNNKGIYLVDEDGNYNIESSQMIRTSITTHSFFGDDEKPVVGAIIDLNSSEGQDFIDGLISENPSLSNYIGNAGNNKDYDFKAKGIKDNRGDLSVSQYHYRGSVDSKGRIGSARDYGNIGAGLVSARKGLLWPVATMGFDLYHSISNRRIEQEGLPTRLAQKVGYFEIGGHLRVNDKVKPNGNYITR